MTAILTRNLLLSAHARSAPRSEVAREAGVRPSAVAAACRRHGVPLPYAGRGRPVVPIPLADLIGRAVRLSGPPSASPFAGCRCGSRAALLAKGTSSHPARLKCGACGAFLGRLRADQAADVADRLILRGDE